MPFLKSSFLLLCFAALPAWLQARGRTEDSNYVREFPNNVTLRIYTGEKLAGFRLSDRSHSEALKFDPTYALMQGLGITVRGIGINIAFKLPFQEGLEDKYGNTRHLDIQVHRYRKKLLLDVYLQHYRGFHLSDKEAVQSIAGPEEYPYFPNMRSNMLGASGMYLFNGRRYSIQSLVNQQDCPLRSSGTLMLGGSLFAHFLSNGDSSLLPSNLKQVDFLGGVALRSLRNYGLCVNLGYGYNLVFLRHWFLSLSGDGGLGIGYAEATEMNQVSQEKWGLNLIGNLRLGGGYNSEKWFAGFYVLYGTSSSPLPYDQSWLSMSQGIFRITTARRFTTHNRWLVRNADRQGL